MNIILHEIKSNLKGLVIWILALGSIFVLASMEYEVFAGNEEIMVVFEDFGFIFDAMTGGMGDMTTPEGYLSVVSIYIYLPLAIYSGLLGSNIISKEERDKTAEYLFTLPVKREKVLLSKTIVALLLTITINVILLLTTYFAFGRLGTTESYNNFVLNMAVGVLITQFIFLTFGMALSAVLKQYKRSGSITIGVLIGTFMLHILIGMTDKIDFMKYVTPFQYFSVEKMGEGDFQTQFIILSVVLVTGFISSLLYFYKKRDLYI